ncbi:hypothetical protein O6072_06635 [Mycolicibacterium neoaurum]|uniref:hypothetical protein n=1 Tax=Mycolicibacterium neoaurum TaxID=1795 RepID=UPI00248C83BC|nr:hypothetical protein [Mycolicibacterium neoaurum]MDO3401779.1 hypothetical protein [Mycolicibacterium neoaurum]WBP95850.1 hypothetical protein O7W24_06640 [Mycolicibacterium neoaurum]WBS09535.1 hypothetical protein O6072_06635 [Mycolicibacterium neoaurum]
MTDTATSTSASLSVDADDETPDQTVAAAKPETKGPRRISISLRAAVVTAVICVLAAGCAVLGWMYLGARSDLAARDQSDRNNQRAEQMASDYAVHAAEMNYQDFEGWKVKLVDGTSPELKDKLTKAADSMQQILAPLQWTSSARPLAAKVRSDVAGVYTVDAFVSVLTKTMQAPDGLQSTATYSVTLDSNDNWRITDVGGIDSALGK